MLPGCQECTVIAALEIQQGVSEQPVAAHAGAKGGRHHAQVLADHQAVGTATFQAQEGHQRLAGIVDIEAGIRRFLRQAPPGAQEGHGMVHSQGAATPHVLAQQRDKGAIATRADAQGMQHREPPALPLGGERVGRRAYARRTQVELWLALYLGAVGYGAHRQVAHQPQTHAQPPGFRLAG
ncbi:MAG: hypothetical protein CME40_15515 [Haliea sp.]|nr:hypothetical protein [Haliea sp.]